MTNTEGSASSSEEELVISAVFADKLLHGSHKRTWFHIIFGFLRHNQADRIELRSFCKLFRDLLRPPSQIWTQFPHSVHTTWRSLIDAVNASWRKDAKKAPTLIVVRKPKTRYVHPNVRMQEGEYVPFFEIIGEDFTDYERSFQIREYDCSANDFVREIGGEGENDELVLDTLKWLATMLFRERRLSTAENLARRILKVNERVSGVEHPDTLDAIGSLGWPLMEQGKLDEAELLF